LGLVSIFTQDMLRYIVMVFPVYAVLRVLFLGIKRVRPVASREVLLGLCVMYGIGLVSQTLLPHAFYGMEDLKMYVQAIMGPYRNFNLVPMHTIWSYLFTQNDQVSNWGSVATLNLLANILLFVPLGFLLPQMTRGFTGLRKTMMFGLATSLAIEILQFFIGRSADVDDVILNVLGVCIGYAVLVVARRVFAPAKLAVATESA